MSSLSQRLWHSYLKTAQACLDHPFVAGIADGSLGSDVFRGYVAQDAFFLRAFGRSYALVAARAPDEKTLVTSHALLGGAPSGPYQLWIETYAGPGFDELAAGLEALLDEHAGDGDEAAIAIAFGRAMELEYSFFDGCWCG